MNGWQKMGSALAVVAVLGWAGCDGGGGGGGGVGGGHDFGDNDPGVVVALGDSITEGVGVSSTYPDLLAGMIGKTVRNRGSGGAKAGDGAAVIQGVLQGEKPGYVLILYGANDAVTGTPPEDTIGALGAIIEACKDNKTIPVIATLTPMQGSHAAFAAVAKDLSRRIRSLGGQAGAHVCDLENEFGNPSPFLQDDGLHPTDEGNAVIADTFAAILN